MYVMQPRISFGDFLDGSPCNHSIEDDGVLLRTWRLAATEHKGQVRRSGGQYIEHPMAVAKMAREVGLPVEDQTACLMHDAGRGEDGTLTEYDIIKAFGPVRGPCIAFKVMALTKKGSQTVADYLLQIQVASERDWAIILDKMFDRLHNLVCPYGGRIERERAMLEETLGPFRELCQRCRNFIPEKFLSDYDEILSQIITLAEQRLTEIQSSVTGPV